MTKVKCSPHRVSHVSISSLPLSAPTEATVKSKLWESGFVRFGCRGYTPLHSHPDSFSSSSCLPLMQIKTIFIRKISCKWVIAFLKCYGSPADVVGGGGFLFLHFFPLMAEVRSGVMMTVWNEADNSYEKWTVRTRKLHSTCDQRQLHIRLTSPTPPSWFLSSLYYSIWILEYQHVCMIVTHMTKAY